ncbi:hypothetical protein [Streptomyces geysiriensis]|uniref:hypothetical protein n=1 Tax=Streptomyces geysiriensis TaxID=68207 RepID=UPI00404013B7
MLTSRAFGRLAKLLEALRAHDARIVESLAEQQAPSRYKPGSKDDSGKKTSGSGEGSGGVSAPAKALLKFSTPRDPAGPRRVHQPARPHPRARALAARRGSRRHLRP